MLYILNFCGRAIAVTFKLRSSGSRRCCAWNSFPKSCFKVHGTMDMAHISPFAISLRLMVDTHGGTRERRPRVAGCIPSVVLTNVRPKIRLTGPGPAFTSPPLQRSPAPFLVNRSSRPHSISTPTFAAWPSALNNRRTHSQLETNENFTRRRKHFCHYWRCRERHSRIDLEMTESLVSFVS